MTPIKDQRDRCLEFILISTRVRKWILMSRDEVVARVVF